MPAGIILIHGYSGFSEDLRALAVRLESVFGPGSVTALRLPGHTGRTTPSFDEGLFVEAISSAVGKFRAAGRDVIFAGHSTGGVLALSFLAKSRMPVRLLVLAAAPKKITTDSLAHWSSHRSEKPKLPFVDVAEMVSFINRTGALRPGGAFPVLVLHGEKDELVPVQEAYSWEKGVFEGHVRTVIIPGAGHHLFSGPESDMAVDVITQAIADAVNLPDKADEEVTARLTEAEPEAKKFLAASPLSTRTLARSPSGQGVIGQEPVLRERAETGPVIANIEITTRCNLACSHCARSFIKTSGEDMPLERFRNVLSLLPHAYRVTLVGLGEPLLHPRVCDLVSEASSQGRRAGLVTNAMRLDGSLAKELLAAGLDSIAFSIDAADEDLASSVRPGTDLKQVVENIRTFLDIMKATRPVSTAVFTAVSTRTVRHLESLIDLVAGLGVHVLMLSDLNFEENRAKTLWRGIDNGMAEAVRKAVARAFSKKLPVLSVHGLEEFGLPSRYDQFLLVPPDSLYQRSAKRTWCYSPWQTVPVNVRGEVTVCDCQPEEVIGNLLDRPFSEIWNGAKMTGYRRRMLSDDPPGKCRICPRF